MNYRFSLDGTSLKFLCPNCHKKRFVRYKDLETDKYLRDYVGRCDKQTKCAYHYTPKQLLQQYNFENESLPFLEERYPNLSKATIIKTCLDCCAENEGHWLFLYRFSDYLNSKKSFTMK